MTNLEVDNSKVICPNCCHQFGAISVSDQKARRDAADEIERANAEASAWNARYVEACRELERLQRELAGSIPCPHSRFVARQDGQYCAACGLSAISYQQQRHSGTLSIRRTDEPNSGPTA